MKYEKHKSICSYCGVGCGMIVKKDHLGRLNVEGDEDYPVNKGMLCSKGMNLHHVVQNTSDRLLYPQMRWNRKRDLERVSWDTAMDRAAGVFGSLIKRYGPDSVGLYVSGQCTTEEYYLANKLTKGFIGTNNIDTNSRLCMSSAVVGYKKTVGEDAVPISYDDIEKADCFLISGANPAYCHPILFRRIEKHKEVNPNVNIIVVDPRKTKSTSIANLHLQINPGTDILLYNAICRRIIENGDIDDEFITNHSEGFDALKKEVFSISLEESARLCGVPLKQITLAAKYIGESKGFLSMWAMGLNQSAKGVDKNLALININLITGQIGKPGAGPFSLTGQPNAMGGREVGGMANLLAAHMDQDNPDHRQKVADFWGVPSIPSKPGLTATEMFDKLISKELKAIWIICTNPAVSMPDSRKIEKALREAQFVIVQDISNRSQTVEFADLVLPAAGWLEKEGTMTNSERRIAHLPKVVDPPGEALADAEILWKFGQRMGYSGFHYNRVSEVYDEHCRLTKGTNMDISGLNYGRLKAEGSFQWPVPHTDHPGTDRLFTDNKFYTENGLSKIHVPGKLSLNSERLSPEYPLILTTGRVRDQWHTRTRTGKVNKLNDHEPMPFLEISMKDAKARNLSDEEIAIIVSKRGDARVRIRVSETIKPGVIFMPMHWGREKGGDFGRANNLTNNLIDPISKQPAFKYSAVQVIPYKKAKEKICIIGAGASSFHFVESYRALNQADEIHVFSDEDYPFYNRILLPEYVSEHLSWDKLQKIKEKELEKLEINVHSKTKIKSIDKEKKEITTHGLKTHQYDKLILAMGSRPFIPVDVPIHLEGVFTIRKRTDADKLKEYLKSTRLSPDKQHVTIVGGGLLGLEMAAALKLGNIKVTIIQRGSRLMERQLDAVGCRLLEEDVAERDIQLYFNNEVQTIQQTDEKTVLEVSLKSGKSYLCTAVIYAIGTTPNVELPKKAGLDVRRGVVVNEYLRTSERDIFAMGEIVEHEGKMYGITVAAEQQAEVLANYISGDNTKTYEGSVLMNVLKFEDLDLCSIGQVQIPTDEEGYEEVVFQDLSHRYYKKCIVKDDRMVGAILIGDKNEFGEYRRLIESGTELSSKRTELLRNGATKEEVLGPLICTCNSVGKGNITNAIHAGHNTVELICGKTNAGTACGSCKPELKQILDSTLKNPKVVPLAGTEKKRKKAFWRF